jgi:myo-inositol-1(or 4)-monophosphatase
MMEAELTDLLKMAIDATKEAAALLAQQYDEIHRQKKDIHIREKGSPLDLVTDADAASQECILKMLRSRYPDHNFIGEEDDPKNCVSSNSPYTWIIDPLDGTTCFVHGRTNFGVILALQHEGKTILGTMCMPLRNQFFVGCKGRGVTCNDEPLHLRKTRDLADAILCTNTIRRARKGSDGILRVPVLPCASLENYGSAIEEFAEMLLGYNDGAFFDGIRLWDIAAGCFMMEELGGKSEYIHRDPTDRRSGLLAVSSTAPIFEELRRIVFDEKLTEK